MAPGKITPVRTQIIAPAKKKVEVVRPREQPPEGQWGFDVSEGQDPEWIMLYGATCNGKTYRYLQLLDAVRQIDPLAKFYIFDTDVAVRKNITHFPELRASKMMMVQYFEGDGIEVWKRLIPLTKQVLQIVQPRDWIIVDRSSYMWQTAAEYFFFQNTGQRIQDYQKEYYEQNDGKSPDMRQFYSNVINPGYYAWENAIIFESRCNIIFVAGEAELVEEATKVRSKDKQETLLAFSRIGTQPAGQKLTAHKFDSIFYCAQAYKSTTRTKEYYMITVRERRNRAEYDREQVAHFGEDYLAMKAGYSPPSLSTSLVRYVDPEPEVEVEVEEADYGSGDEE